MRCHPACQCCGRAVGNALNPSSRKLVRALVNGRHPVRGCCLLGTPLACHRWGHLNGQARPLALRELLLRLSTVEAFPLVHSSEHSVQENAGSNENDCERNSDR